MPVVPLISNERSHLTKVLRDLVSCGWTLASAPENKRVPRNGAKVVLTSEEIDLRLRIFVYKVTSSGRNRPHERRVEITTTYQSGLAPLRRFADIVLGLDEPTGRYVGIDGKRLRFGASTHNASSFFCALLGFDRTDLLAATRTGWGWLTPWINPATAQPGAAKQLLERGEHLLVVWQRVSNDEPGGTPLAIFQVFEKSAIESISDPPRDRRFIKLKSRLEF